MRKTPLEAEELQLWELQRKLLWHGKRMHLLQKGRVARRLNTIAEKLKETILIIPKNRRASE